MMTILEGKATAETGTEYLLPIEVDPCDHFVNNNPRDILEACGLVLPWVLEPEFIELPLREALDKQYSFGLFEMTGGTVTPSGSYVYPGDPPLYPLVRVLRNGETFLMYPHAIVAIISRDGSTFITRMD